MLYEHIKYLNRKTSMNSSTNKVLIDSLYHAHSQNIFIDFNKYQHISTASFFYAQFDTKHGYVFTSRVRL